MKLDGQTMSGKDVTCSAGDELRFYVADLTNARLRVTDNGRKRLVVIGRAAMFDFYPETQSSQY